MRTFRQLTRILCTLRFPHTPRPTGRCPPNANRIPPRANGKGHPTAAGPDQKRAVPRPAGNAASTDPDPRTAPLMHPVQRPDATLRSARGPLRHHSPLPLVPHLTRARHEQGSSHWARARATRRFVRAVWNARRFHQTAGPCRSVSRRDNWSIRKRRTRAGIAAGSAACLDALELRSRVLGRVRPCKPFWPRRLAAPRANRNYRSVCNMTWVRTRDTSARTVRRKPDRTE
jgi:hypothetical protein